MLDFFLYTWNCLSGVAIFPCFSVMCSTEPSNPITTRSCLLPSSPSLCSHLLHVNLYSWTHPPLGRSNSGKSANSSFDTVTCFFFSFFFFSFLLRSFLIFCFFWLVFDFPYSSSSSARSSRLLLSPIDSSSLKQDNFVISLLEVK